MRVEVVTIGETMVAFIPNTHTALRYVEQFAKVVAGAESNVAVGLAKLGHKSGWLSKLGDDEFGQFILRELRGENVDVSSVLISETHPTGIMFKQFSNDKDSSVFYYRSNSAASTFKADELDRQYIAQAKILLISGITPALSESCEQTVLAAVKLAREHGVLVCFDPNIRRKLWSEQQAKKTLEPLLSLSDIVLLGDDEAALLLGTAEPRQIVTSLRNRGVRWIGIKQGAKGAYVADCESECSIPPYPVTVVDSIGAGDAFNAGFISGLLEGKSIETCGKMGAMMGALAVSSYGDFEGLPNRKAFDRMFSNTQEARR
ncbi:sugar kinase [Sphaerochaeta sp. PS]|uniref:sugar kinase n=1 Tax=Sphaerochaeta sp. PS TaxID=3076336 RepID=UPI0028A4BDFF|nr:sugar kinase [Sphaerochaeta sp. PS]MDT4762778.1 sugar kinase [Sphaerochaeta sp. PS]